MQYTDEFLALTQVGVALTGFMGIVITLRTGSLSALGAVTRARVQDLLILPLGVMFFALAPSIIAGFLANGELAWRSAMFLWALYVVFACAQYFVATRFKQATRWEIITLAFAVLIVLAMFTTALGFYAFLPTSYRGLSELGFIAGSGMFIAFLVTLILLPALTRLLDLGRREGPGGSPGYLSPLVSRLCAWGRFYPKTVLTLALGLALAALALLPGLRFDDDPINLRNPEAPAVKTYRALAAAARTEPYAIEILTAGRNQAERLMPALSALPSVRKVETLSSYLPADQAEKLAVIDDMAAFLSGSLAPPDRSAVPQPGARRAALQEMAGLLAGDPAFFGAAGERLAAAFARLATPGRARSAHRR